MSFNVNDLKQSKFLTQNDVDPPVLVTITGDDKVNVALEGVDPEYRYVLTFKELEKPLVLNTTNGQIITAIVGSENSDDWLGRKIVLYKDPNVSFGGKLVGGIRCRAQRNLQEPPVEAPKTKEEQAAQAVVEDDMPF